MTNVHGGSYYGVIFSDRGVISFIQILRVLSIILTHYAVSVARIGVEGNFFCELLGFGVIPFMLLGTAGLFLASILVVGWLHTGKLRILLLSSLCIFVTLDFINDLPAVFLRVQILSL